MSLLFPTHCILCGQTISEQARGLCKACRAQIETEMQTLTCYPPEYVSDLVCAAQYRGSYRAALLHIKYAHEPYRLYPIAELMAQAWEVHEMPLPVCRCMDCIGFSEDSIKVRNLLSISRKCGAFRMFRCSNASCARTNKHGCLPRSGRKMQPARLCAEKMWESSPVSAFCWLMILSRPAPRSATARNCCARKSRRKFGFLPRQKPEYLSNKK